MNNYSKNAYLIEISIFFMYNICISVSVTKTFTQMIFKICVKAYDYKRKEVKKTKVKDYEKNDWKIDGSYTGCSYDVWSCCLWRQ